MGRELQMWRLIVEMGFLYFIKIYGRGVKLSFICQEGVYVVIWGGICS